MKNDKNSNCILYYKNKIPILNKKMMNIFIKNNQEKKFLNFDNILIIIILCLMIGFIVYLYFKKHYN